jgi:CBS domain-containing protein
VKEAEMKVAEVMTTDVLAVTPETSLKEAAELLVREQISGVPVIDADRTVLGVLSESDILFKERPRPEEKPLLQRLLGRADPSLRTKPDAMTAGEAMTAPPITIEPFAPVAVAAERMLEAHVHRLPVVIRRQLTGIVTRADLVRAFVRPDEEIKREISDIVRLCDSEGPLEITVERGVVELSGRLYSRVDAEAIPSLVEQVPGVTKLTTRLDWRWDPAKAGVSSR